MDPYLQSTDDISMVQEARVPLTTQTLPVFHATTRSTTALWFGHDTFTESVHRPDSMPACIQPTAPVPLTGIIA